MVDLGLHDAGDLAVTFRAAPDMSFRPHRMGAKFGDGALGKRRTEFADAPVLADLPEEHFIEREPITDGDARGAVGEVGEEEVSVTVHEERPVVEKEVVAKERVGLGKETVTEEREVTANVAHEEVTLDKDGVRGDGRDGVHGDARRDHDGNPLT